DAKPRASSAAPSSAACLDRVPRAEKDRRDRRKGRLVHVVYLLASDAPDESLDTNGTLDCSMRAQNRWMREQSGMQWRLDTFKTRVSSPGGGSRVVEAVDVTFIRTKIPREELSDASIVTRELELRGFKKERKRYLSFVAGGDDSGVCGDAWYPFLNNDPNSDGKYAQVYMFAVKECGGHDFGVPGKPSFAETIAQQEIMHNDGMVPIGAPHGCGPISLPAHVCTPGLWASAVVGQDLDPERFDVMFPFVGLPLSEKKLDIGRDDYFAHPFPLRDLDESPYLEKARR
ncbi:MAG: hypothetical protein M3271_09890, partial [Actinomycetota bacterium]|nr:hypothetical protein [Actinomycetota bacterium]